MPDVGGRWGGPRVQTVFAVVVFSDLLGLSQEGGSIQGISDPRTFSFHNSNSRTMGSYKLLPREGGSEEVPRYPVSERIGYGGVNRDPVHHRVNSEVYSEVDSEVYRGGSKEERENSEHNSLIGKFKDLNTKQFGKMIKI